MEYDISISIALFELKPDAQWNLVGTNYSDIEWTDSVHTKPTEEEINAKILEMKLAEPLRLLRVERNKLLIATDWTQTPDIPESIRIKWASYRQALRDLPANTSDPENPIYLKDYELDEKMKTWIQVFTSLLIDKCNENEGQVKDCEIILASTKGYRQKQDFYSQFFNENVGKAGPKDKIKKQEIRDRFNEWYQNEYSAKPPKAQELYDYLDKCCGKWKKGGWWNYKIVYDSYESESDEEEVE